MADPAQIQEKGSGEGSSEVKPTETASVESKPVQEVKTVESPKTDNVPLEQAETNSDTAQIATQTSVIDGDTKPEGTQTKAPEANSNVQETTSVVDAIEKKEDPIKETVLIAELNIPKVDDQPKDASTVSATEAKDTPTVPVAEVKDTSIAPAAEVKDTPVVPAAEVKTEEVKHEDSTSATKKEDGDWQNREQELLKKIEELEKFKKEKSEDGLKLELKVREEEIDLLKARVKNLETELQAALSKPGKNHEMMEKIKQQHEELLSKARGMIFDKTKMVKNQELQIEALTTQVQSLKDINLITKDLLEIRNSEVKAMEDRLQVMEARFKAEKERYDLVLKRAQTSTNINDDLRREYETQLGLFKELREKYELRVQALVAENNRLKESNGGTSG